MAIGIQHFSKSLSEKNYVEKNQKIDNLFFIYNHYDLSRTLSEKRVKKKYR